MNKKIVEIKELDGSVEDEKNRRWRFPKFVIIIIIIMIIIIIIIMIIIIIIGQRGITNINRNWGGKQNTWMGLYNNCIRMAAGVREWIVTPTTVAKR